MARKPKPVFTDHDTHDYHHAIRGGDRVVTDYTGDLTYHNVIRIIPRAAGQSGIAFVCDPPVGNTPLDAAWFRPSGPGSEWARLERIANEIDFEDSQRGDL